jgi:hypothetical protein
VILSRRKAIVSGAAAVAAYSRLGRSQFVSLGGNGQPAGAVLGLPEQWLMHDGFGESFADATPNGNTITTTDITWGTGTGVTSPTFNGSTSTGVAAQTAITNFDGTKPFSVSLWINVAQIESPTEFVGNIVPGSNFQGWELNQSGGTLLFLLINDFPSNTIECNSAVGIAPGTTTNVIITYDGSQNGENVTFYFNGVSSPTTIVTNTLTASTASGIPIHVGSRSDGSNPYSGSMSSLQIFSGVLSTLQIAAIQVAGP